MSMKLLSAQGLIMDCPIARPLSFKIKVSSISNFFIDTLNNLLTEGDWDLV